MLLFIPVFDFNSAGQCLYVASLLNFANNIVENIMTETFIKNEIVCTNTVNDCKECANQENHLVFGDVYY